MRDLPKKLIISLKRIKIRVTWMIPKLELLVVMRI